METKHIQKIEETDDAITVTFGKAKPEEEKAKVKADETPEVKEEAPKEEEHKTNFPKDEPEDENSEDKTFENEVVNKELKSKKFYRTATIEKKYYERSYNFDISVK